MAASIALHRLGISLLAAGLPIVLASDDPPLLLLPPIENLATARASGYSDESACLFSSASMHLEG